jgi:hypothetical protein
MPDLKKLGHTQTMTHSTRNSYKDKAMSAGKYRQALECALEATKGLNRELAMREERELELLESIRSLIKPAIYLSGTLRGCAGDFGVGSTYPDTSVDQQLHECRPALIVNRAAVLLNLASKRLDELHLEAGEAENISTDLLEQLSGLERNAKDSIDRRRRLLITGHVLTENDVVELGKRSNEYSYDKAQVSATEIYDVNDIESSDESSGDESDRAGDAQPTKRSSAATIIEKFEKKHVRKFQ